MKKSYLKKNLLAGVHSFLCYGWETKQFLYVSCPRDADNAYNLSSISGDLVYFKYTDCEGLYDDFIIRFGSNFSRETIQDIEIFRVCLKDGQVRFYKLESFIHIENKCICSILGEIILALTYVIK